MADTEKKIDKVKVKDFLDKYNSVPESKIRKSICSNFIVRKYVPAFEKYIALLSVFNQTCRDFNGNLQFNNFVWTLTYRMAIVGLYTNLNVAETDEQSMPFGFYDDLKETGALNDLLSLIDEEEVKELMMVRDAIFSDADMNENNLVKMLRESMLELNRLSNDVTQD